MDEENKKLNNEQEISDEEQAVYEEITESARDIASEYDDGLSREEKLRAEAEKKHELEMEAIRQDIERRYSLQIEETEKSINAVAGENEEQSDSSAQSGNIAMLDEIINLDAFIGTDKKSSKKDRSSKKKKKKEQEYIDLDEKGFLYFCFYDLGDIVIRFFEFIFRDILGVIFSPVIKLIKNIKSSGGENKRSTKEYIDYLRKERKAFRREFAKGFFAVLGAFRHPKTLPSVIWHYMRKPFDEHRHFIKTMANIALPVISLAIMISVFSYWNNRTFALKVYYGSDEIGYIADENVFTDAKSIFIDRLNSNGISSELTVASAEKIDVHYELAVVSLDKLDDAKTISDSMIEHSADNLTHACGIYIDNNFVCAVKNEADARTVFYNFVKPYEADALEGGYSVGILQDIDYIQGLYSDEKDIMWDASTLSDYIENNDVLKIKKVFTTTEAVPVPYSTVTTKDASKYSGYRVVRQAGVDGVKNVVTTIVYVDGDMYGTYTTDEILVEPVDELVTVGGITSFGGVYIGEASSMGFLWPTPHCHYISSPYGWRSSGWHKGIDLCTNNGTASGSPVIASMSGTVELVQHSSSGYGNMVLINHGNGYKTRYAHLLEGSITVKTGDYVEGGQTIGKVGSTGNSSGPHLHFEVIYNGETRNPKDYISL